MTPPNLQHYEDWDLFALELLDPQEAGEMSAHLVSGCDTCSAQYQAAKALLAGLATLSPDEQLPPGAEARLRQRLAGERAPATIPLPPNPAARRWNFWNVVPWVFAAAGLLVAVGLGLNLNHTNRELHEQQRQNAEFASRLQQQPITAIPDSGAQLPPTSNLDSQNLLEQLRRDLQTTQAAKAAVDQQLKDAQAQIAKAQNQIQELDASLKDADARRTKAEDALAASQLQLASVRAEAGKLARASGQDAQIANLLESAKLSQLDLKPAGSAQAFARVFWQDDRGLLLVARDLPQLPADGSFQLWFYRNDASTLVNVGVLQLENPGTGVLFVPPGPALRSMAGALVTEESEPRSVSTPGIEILKVKP
jgi:Anti-sigma-K factor rskA